LARDVTVHYAHSHFRRLSASVFTLFIITSAKECFAVRLYIYL